ncbi:hypothetical protein GQ43DRAFT_440892 [Delitschia confertaspora ATCC 74209]|uniref:F-box domain-containing protein n=1 Tax=Delitschia confertaspora ATCC 74209 TaxID=1513339 RepID=A0A9P4JKJ6_9PLEO|nr:hypothetical protein GQ43DRAFT_440892 [Delitschia confertaspora ATCC 74209]
MSAFPLLRLPRELRDHIYDYVFAIPDTRCARSLRIERRHLTYFRPTAASILLILHQECLLLNQQVAAEALELLLKKHTVLFSCGPFVLNSFLSRIEQEPTGQGKKWLKSLKHVEMDWVTFPNMRFYPPRWNNSNSSDEDYDPDNATMLDEDYIWDYEGEGYDDNLYNSSTATVWPSYQQQGSSSQNQAAPGADPFGFASHNPFSNPLSEPTYDVRAQQDVYSALDYLVDTEVKPLFTFLSSKAFALSTMTLPLYFISQKWFQHRVVSRPDHVLPLKLRYWVNAVAHAVLLLCPPDPAMLPKLKELRIKYMPWDIWASMDPSENLQEICERGIWGRDDEVGYGEAFKAVWEELQKMNFRFGKHELDINVRYVKWEMDLDQSSRVGDELEVIIKRPRGF